MEKNNGIKENKNSKVKILNKWTYSAIFIGVFILIVYLFTSYGYAKYIAIKEGNATAEIAKMVCKMNVVASDKDDDTIINPYCIVTVTDSDATDGITQTDVEYVIEITAKDGYELPSYELYRIENEVETKYAEDIDITGNFVNNNVKTDKYKVVFINPGDRDILRTVEFNLTATQTK